MITFQDAAIITREDTISTGDSANILTPHVGDANTMIPEFKAFLVNVRKV